jgi:simple sugar transport system ATP-binding protein
MSGVAAISPAPGDLLLDFAQVSKTFGGVRALQDVSFDVRPGEVLCLAGENGCGKSTLIKIISGVHQPEPGARMMFDGRNVSGLNPAMARRLGIQVIWQDLALFPEMTVVENIGFENNLGRPRLVDYGGMQRQASAILDRLGVSLDLHRRLGSLPIAQRQIAAIARALIAEARLVFMDEPTASLSQSETDALLTIVRRLSAQGIAVVFVSHRLAEVLNVCTRVTVLRDGRNAGTFPTSGMTQTRLTELMTGHVFETNVRARDLSDRPVTLALENLSRPGQYENISLSIRSGEVLGLCGRLGAGRTELALSLFGMTQPASGTIRLEGREVAFHTNRAAIDAGVAYVSEDRLQLGLIQPQSIADNTIITTLDRLLGPARLISQSRAATLVDHWVRELAVRIGSPDNAVSTLSGGNQQRIVLAKWLTTNPRLLILDSPTVGVDVGAREGIFAIVRRLAEQGLAILLISDEVPELYFNADRILHMRGGRILTEYVPGKVTMNQIEEELHA